MCAEQEIGQTLLLDLTFQGQKQCVLTIKNYSFISKQIARYAGGTK